MRLSRNQGSFIEIFYIAPLQGNYSEGLMINLCFVVDRNLEWRRFVRRQR